MGSKNLVLYLLVLLVACSSSQTTVSRKPRVPSGINFKWPIKGTLRITDYFGWRSSSRMHFGIDIDGNRGTSIYAAESGVVSYAGWMGAFGRVVLIQHKGNYSSLYAHLSKFSVKKEQAVGRLQKIGNVGRSGRATGTHLHFEIRFKSDPVDPLYFLPKKKFPKVVHSFYNVKTDS